MPKRHKFIRYKHVPNFRVHFKPTREVLHPMHMGRILVKDESKTFKLVEKRFGRKYRDIAYRKSIGRLEDLVLEALPPKPKVKEDPSPIPVVIVPPLILTQKIVLKGQYDGVTGDKS